ncbi:uncharacterized protein LOC125716453 [Brienomyrus brachyistius]|uniref:uncharacterized protein LOC125716453 n=1 Tax=Brienomyrus brachyistius TaxID=42636 RepID=UPI0020B187EF|nr:uncharacterized protein LOC125716453 [Brienomyrus brachyistius]
MAGDEAPRPLVLLLMYLLMKRRKDMNDAEAKRRKEVRRRIAHRQHFLQRQRRMLMVLIAYSTSYPCNHRTRAWTTIKSSDWWERVVMNEFQPHDWLEKFRMSKDTFFFLCGKLKARLAKRDTRLRPALPVEKRVAVALWRLATNMEYRTIGVLFSMGRSTVCKCVRDVCHSIAALLGPAYLRPPGVQELDEAAGLYERHWGFPHCVGVVGSLHVPIVTPSGNTARYRNSAGWLSVVLQGTVNGLGQFWDVCACFPGSTEDSVILQNSTLWAAATEGALSPQTPRPFMGRPLQYLLLGTEAYPLQTWLLKSYTPSPRLTPGQRAFNDRLNRTRDVLDATFLRLKARWQCLYKHNDCGLDLVPSMILACCILHNVCEVHRDSVLDEWLDEVSRDWCPQPCASLPVAADDPAAEEVRSLFCEYVLQQQNE